MEEMIEVTSQIGNGLHRVMQDLEDLRDGALLLGMKPLAEKIERQIRAIEPMPERLSKACGGAVRDRVKASEESAWNTVQAAMAVASR